MSARALRRELNKRALLLDELGAGRFDLSGRPPNRRAWLAQTGRQQINQALARMKPERRYPVLMCFCVEALERSTDDAIEIYDRALGAADRAAQRKREELERRGRRDIQATVSRFINLSTVVLEAHDSGADVLRLIERRIGIERLREDLGRAHGIARPQPTGHLDLVIADGGAAGRKLLAAVIASLELRPTGVDEDELLAALQLIRQLADDKRRWLPGFSPSSFIDAQWRPHVGVASSKARNPTLSVCRHGCNRSVLAATALSLGGWPNGQSSPRSSPCASRSLCRARILSEPPDGRLEALTSRLSAVQRP